MSSFKVDEKDSTSKVESKGERIHKAAVPTHSIPMYAKTPALPSRRISLALTLIWALCATLAALLSAAVALLLYARSQFTALPPAPTLTAFNNGLAFFQQPPAKGSPQAAPAEAKDKKPNSSTVSAVGKAVAPAVAPDNSACRPIDLTKYYTTPASSFDRMTQYPWPDAPRGKHTFGNIPLEIGGMICLWGSWNAERQIIFPKQVPNIVVGRKFEALYLYHITWPRTPDGTPVADLVFRYGDGTSLTNNLYYGMHVRDWTERKDEPATPNDPNSRIVWRCVNSKSRSVPPSMLRFFITELANPKPSLEVATIDLYSVMTRNAPCMMAMTTGPAQLLMVDPALMEAADPTPPPRPQAR